MRWIVLMALAMAVTCRAQDKPADNTVDPERLRVAQQRLAEKSAGGNDVERLRFENERLKVELAAVKKELAELRKALRINVQSKGRPTNTEDAIKAYIGSHPNLATDVMAGIHQHRPVPGMTMEELRLFTVDITVWSETLDTQDVATSIFTGGREELRYDLVVRRVDGVILKVKKLNL